MRRLLRESRTRRFCNNVTTAFLSAFGLIGAAVSLASPFVPDAFKSNFRLVWIILLCAVVWTLYRVWPRRVHQRFEGNFGVEVVVGDLFTQEDSAAIGMCDTFDVSTSAIIAPTSVQGQLLTRVWGSDEDALRRDLAAALAPHVPVDHVLKDGNQDRYPIGTTAKIEKDGRAYYCVAYSKMDEHNVAKATISGITESLFSLWESVDRSGNGRPICVPLIGQGRSRLNALSPEASIRLIALTFVLRSTQARLADSLRIVIHPQDVGRIDLREFAAFLRTMPGAC